MGGPTAPTVTFVGKHRTDARTLAMLREAARISGVSFTVVQGSYSNGKASAGTHRGGGVVDIRTWSLTPKQRKALDLALRQVGFAEWYRTLLQGFAPHIHAAAIGCHDLDPSAARQVTAYRNDRNGLANNGPDDGPDVPYTTWEQYQASQQLPDTGRDEEIDMTPEQAKQLDELHGRLFRTGYVDMHMSAIDDVILGTKYADYVPGPDGTRAPLTVVGALFSARRDAYYARVDAAVARRLAEEQAKGVTLNDQGIAEIVKQVKAELPDAIADELSDRLDGDQ